MCRNGRDIYQISDFLENSGASTNKAYCFTAAPFLKASDQCYNSKLRRADHPDVSVTPNHKINMQQLERAEASDITRTIQGRGSDLKHFAKTVREYQRCPDVPKTRRPSVTSPAYLKPTQTPQLHHNKPLAAYRRRTQTLRPTVVDRNTWELC